MGYRDPMWPKEKIPGWLLYIFYGILLLLFLWLYPVIFDGNDNGEALYSSEWVER